MTRVFGRVHTMSALVITGNGEGLVGYAVGKAGIHRTTNAIVKGMRAASRKLFFVELLENRTIFQVRNLFFVVINFVLLLKTFPYLQDFYGECRNTRIYAQRRPPGFGLICHPRLIKICEVDTKPDNSLLANKNKLLRCLQAIGIKDLYAKVEGNTKNYQALTHAFLTGLLNQESHTQLAERTGLHVVEMNPNRNFLPEIVASPTTRKLKTDEEMTPEEVCFFVVSEREFLSTR